jgi:hypothetical protein
VERRNGFFETSFMPGRQFTSPADLNAQFASWIERANSRVVRTIRARPADLIEADRAAMLPLPPAPPQLGWHNRVRLGRDCYVRPGASDYSVDPAVIGRLVDVSADLERVRARLDGRVVADHASVWARGTTVTDPGHAQTARRLREEFRRPLHLERSLPRAGYIGAVRHDPNPLREIKHAVFQVAANNARAGPHGSRASERSAHDPRIHAARWQAGRAGRAPGAVVDRLADDASRPVSRAPDRPPSARPMASSVPVSPAVRRARRAARAGPARRA